MDEKIIESIQTVVLNLEQTHKDLLVAYSLVTNDTTKNLPETLFITKRILDKTYIKLVNPIEVSSELIFNEIIEFNKVTSKLSNVNQEQETIKPKTEQEVETNAKDKEENLQEAEEVNQPTTETDTSNEDDSEDEEEEDIELDNDAKFKKKYDMVK